MQFVVLTASHHLQVFFAVVLAVLVFVVDALAGFERAPNHSLGNENVLRFLIRATAGTVPHKYFDIPMGIDASATFPPMMIRPFPRREKAEFVLLGDLTGFGAELRSTALHFTGPCEERSTAGNACSFDVLCHFALSHYFWFQRTRAGQPSQGATP